jgi:hypothetical protein
MQWLLTAAVIFGLLTIGWIAGSLLTMKQAFERGGKKKHWIFYGWALGVFGPYLLKKIGRSCPGCTKEILREAHQCPYCQIKIERMQAEENPVDPFWSYRQNWSSEGKKDT